MRRRLKKFDIDKIMTLLRWLSIIAVILYGKGDWDKTNKSLDALKTAVEIALLRGEQQPKPPAPQIETVIYKEAAPGVIVPVIDETDNTDTEPQPQPETQQPADTESTDTEDISQLEELLPDPMPESPETQEESNVQKIHVAPETQNEPQKTRWVILITADFDCPPCRTAQAALQKIKGNIRIIDKENKLYKEWLKLAEPVTGYPVILCGEQTPDAAFTVVEKLTGYDRNTLVKIEKYLSESEAASE